MNTKPGDIVFNCHNGVGGKFPARVAKDRPYRVLAQFGDNSVLVVRADAPPEESTTRNSTFLRSWIQKTK